MKTRAKFVEPDGAIEFVPQILHLRKILVPIDFSETSRKAFQYALRFAEQFGSEIFLLHVLEPASPVVGAPLALEVFPDDRDPFSTVEKRLETFCTQPRSNGANSINSTIRTGHAPNEITKAAKDLDIDLVVIATHGYTSWRHLCIGSTAERVVRSAPCPVLVVREKDYEFV
jgi:universal stress protein A